MRVGISAYFFDGRQRYGYAGKNAQSLRAAGRAADKKNDKGNGGTGTPPEGNGGTPSGRDRKSP